MRLIDADTIVHYQTYDDEHEEFPEHESTIADFLDEMTDEGCQKPVDAVPVVRCRNCRFSQRINDWVYYCYVFNVDKILNQYCDMGERKDGGDEKAD